VLRGNVFLRSLFVLALMMQLNSVARAQLKAHDLHARIEFAKQEYLECESVWLFLFIENRGTEAVEIQRIGPTDTHLFSVNLTDSLGKRLDYTGIIIDYAYGYQPPKVSIAAGDTAVFPIDLIEGYGMGGLYTHLPLHIPVGSYTVSGTLFADIQVNKCVFTVTPLDDQSDSLLAAYWKIACTVPDRLTSAERIANLLAEHPTCPATRVLCEYLLADVAYQPELYQLKMNHYKMVIERFPESGLFQRSIDWLMGRLSQAELRELYGGDKKFKRSRIASFVFRKEAHRLGRDDLAQEVMGQ
jgi:hypothetical protein